MSILNFLRSGSSAHVDDVYYSKQYKSVHFSLNVYRDTSKTMLETSLRYTLMPEEMGRYTKVYHYMKNGDAFIDDLTALVRMEDGSFKISENKLEPRHLYEKELFHDVESDLLYDKDWNCIDALTERKWLSFFGFEVLSAEGANLHSQIYKYLKTLSSFEGMEDA